MKVNLKNENTNLTIVVTRRLFADTACQDFMIGSEQSYTFKFNQGDVYEVTIVQKEKDKAATTTLIDTNHNNIYKSTVYAGNDEISYTVTINKTESGVAMPVNTLGASIVGSGLQDGLMAKQVAFAGMQVLEPLYIYFSLNSEARYSLALRLLSSAQWRRHLQALFPWRQALQDLS